MSEGRRVAPKQKSYKRSNGEERKSGKSSIFFKIMALAYIIITVIFYISVVKMDLLPGKYITIFSIAEIIATLGITIGLAKRHKTYKLNIVCLIIAILISSIYIYVTNYTMATSNFLSNVFKEVKETKEYYVVVNKESKYNKVEDIKGKTVHLFQIEDEVKKEVESKSSAKYENVDDLTTLGSNLISKKEEVILLSSVQYDILSEEIENFKDKTKIIYTVSHEVDVNSDIEDKNSKHNVSSGVFNIYISGIDTSGKISKVARSDANIIATVNTKTHEVLLTSIPRDYYVPLHTYKSKDKLTHSGIYGINETVRTVEDLLDIDINYYVRVNFTTVIKLVDILGGIDVYSDYDFTTVVESVTYNFKKGYNHVNGKKALVFSRERYALAGGDNQRVKNQQHVIEAIMKKVLNSNTLLTKYTKILDSLNGCFQTNLEQEEISKIVKDQLNDMSSWTVKSNALTGTGSNASTYSMGSQKLYVMIPNASSVNEAKSKIQQTLGK